MKRNADGDIVEDAFPLTCADISDLDAHVLAMVQAQMAQINYSQIVGAPASYTDAQAQAAALVAALTGLGAGANAAITATDTVLGAFAKLQAQISAAMAAVQPTVTSISPALVGTGATGSQASATKGAFIIVNYNESVTSSIGGAAVAAINVKICPTNNATEGAWTTIFTFEEDQTVTLAIALQSVQVMKGGAMFFLPAGYYWKAESSGSGTNSEGVLGGQQIVFG